MRRISWTIIALSFLLSSCVTPKEYVYMFPDPVKLPTLEESISPDMMEDVHAPLDLVMEPKTVGDILHNMQEYQNGYMVMRSYSYALEEYINRIIAIHNGIKDGEDGSI